MVLGGWAITQQCFDWILDNVPLGSKVLEFGSGDGTGELAKHFEMTSIEESSDWLNIHPSKYIHAPLENGWYSLKAIEDANLDEDYAMILVDGPTKRLRGGMKPYVLSNLSLFENCLVVFDDTNRESDMVVCDWFIEQGFVKVAEMMDERVVGKPSPKQFTVLEKNTNY
tara:strand:+ start:449 stop:955 length:507 start_codon:yes stop_codon:yes gene_type:complete